MLRCVVVILSIEKTLPWHTLNKGVSVIESLPSFFSCLCSTGADRSRFLLYSLSEMLWDAGIKFLSGWSGVNLMHYCSVTYSHLVYSSRDC